MSDEMKWLIGLFASVGLGIAGYVIASLRGLGNQIAQGDTALHERINRVRDEYVRRDDLREQMQSFKEGLSEMKEENRAMHKEMNARLDQLLRK